MKKGVIFVVLAFLLVLPFWNAMGATPITKGFGGRIIHNKSVQIEALEDASFSCVVVGTTITTQPFGSTSRMEYIIPAGLTGKGGGQPEVNKFILGLYNPTPTIITCTCCSPYTITANVSLPSITLYGISKMITTKPSKGGGGTFGGGGAKGSY